MNKPKTKQPKINPKGAWVLVKPIDQSNMNEYGLIIPDSVEKEKKSQGEVVKVGPKVENVKVGERVLYGMFAGEPIQFGNQHDSKDKVDLLLLLEEDILASLE